MAPRRVQKANASRPFEVGFLLSGGFSGHNRQGSLTAQNNWDFLNPAEFFYRNFTIDMGLTRSEAFTKSQNDLAAMARALGHPARIAIVQFLLKSRSCMCGDIVGQLPLSQSTVSQHLSELKKVGLIKGAIDGPSVCYCIDEKAWMRAKKVFGDLFDAHPGKDCC